MLTVLYKHADADTSPKSQWSVRTSDGAFPMTAFGIVSMLQAQYSPSLAVSEYALSDINASPS